MRLSLCVALLLIPLAWPARAASNQTDLNGFRLWQHRAAAARYFGEPRKTYSAEDQEYLIYNINASSRMVFGYKKTFSRHASSIQITGYPTRMLPFLGLVLGDDMDKVVATLGEPEEIRPLDPPGTELWLYDETNFALEIDRDRRLQSIKIRVTESIMQVDRTGSPTRHWQAFTRAVLRRDRDALLRTLRPDASVVRDGKVLTGAGTRYVDFAAAPNPAFLNAFFGANHSVRARLKAIGTQPSKSLAFSDALGLRFVAKFPRDPVLQEIVFFPYDGEYRVYEVRFRPSRPAAIAATNGAPR